jgi:hypothetical protein
MAGDALGYIKCDGCGEQAAIKKIGNSDLLYMHCKQCGCDRRSGALVQAKWQAAISGEQLPESLAPAQDPDWKPTPETHKTHPAPPPENPESDPEQKTGNSWAMFVGIAVVGIIGVIVKTAKAAKA